MSCNVFWMQKERGSALRPLLYSGACCDQLENRQAERQPMQSTWSCTISRDFSGVTKTSVLSGVRIASVKPSASNPCTRARSCSVSHTRRLRGPTAYSAMWSPTGSAV